MHKTKVGFKAPSVTKVKRIKNISLKTWALFYAFDVMFLDQLSKWVVKEKFFYSETLPILPGFSLTLRHNTGAAFSFLAEASGWQRWFFVCLAFIMTAVIYVWLGRLSSRDKTEAFGLALIMGGALGNVVDRLLYGYVIDFILIYYKDWQFPAFNIADTAISIGVFMFALSMLKKK